MTNAVIHVGDALRVLGTFEAGFANVCVTSPPYYGLRDYGLPPTEWPNATYVPMPGLPPVPVPAMTCCLGLEPTPEAYVGHLVAVFREVRRVLKEDATLWLNIGDSYAAAGGHSGQGASSHRKGRSNVGAQNHSPTKVPPGHRPKNLFGIPWRVAFALQADGWYLRQDCIWQKPNAMPESVRDRCTKAHEYVFLLAKSERYRFDAAAIAEPAAKGAAGSRFNTGKAAEHQMGRASSKPRKAGNKSHKYVTEYEASESEEHRTKAGLMKVADVFWETRNKRSVWPVPTVPLKEAHFATFPPKLAEPCVLAGCPEGGVVLDPFAGAGTALMVALQHGRNAVGVELNEEYAGIAARRIERHAPGRVEIAGRG